MCADVAKYQQHIVKIWLQKATVISLAIRTIFFAKNDFGQTTFLAEYVSMGELDNLKNWGLIPYPWVNMWCLKSLGWAIKFVI